MPFLRNGESLRKRPLVPHVSLISEGLFVGSWQGEPIPDCIRIGRFFILVG